MISVVIPSYNNPEYLDLCIRSAIQNSMYSNEIIVVIDGHPDKYVEVQKKWNGNVNWIVFDRNLGLPMATNQGVYRATSDRILVINEDNVLCKGWDIILNSIYDKDIVWSINQIEPQPSIFDFHIQDFGKTPATFRWDDFLDWENNHRESFPTTKGYLLPFFMKKEHYMVVNGWDTAYSSPFVVDLDFWYKLQQLPLKFQTTKRLAFYHFGSRSTKRRDGAPTVATQMWNDGELLAAKQFYTKWGFYPKRDENNRVVK